MNFPKLFLLVLCILLPKLTCADDWPMWRHDAGRTGVTQESIPKDISLRWSHKLPKLKPAYRTERLQFDAGYEPIVANGIVLFASSYDNSVTALGIQSGTQIWKFFANGPVRLAPAVWKDSVLFGSDDGCFYCLNLKTGKLKWKKRAVPSDRKVLGNGRLISVWPIRGGAVVDQGIVYFTAGVWPFEGVFVYAMDVETGKVIWLNDRLGTIYGDHPHKTVAVGGLAPQGYLVLSEDELIIPNSTAYPARLNRKTGELIEFTHPKTPRFPGGWFASLDPEMAKSVRRGKIIFDLDVNQQRHEDKVQKGKGIPGVSRKIKAGSRTISFDEKIEELPGFEGKVHSLIVANQNVIAVSQSGNLSCYGVDLSAVRRPEVIEANKSDYSPYLKKANKTQKTQVKKMLASSHIDHGFAFVIGIHDGRIIRELLHKTKFHVIVLDSDRKRVENLKALLNPIGSFDPNGVIRYWLTNPAIIAKNKKKNDKIEVGNVARCTVIHLEEGEFGLPPYAAEMITTEDPDRFHSILVNKESAPVELMNSLRPYGGVLCLPNSIGTVHWKTILEKLPESYGDYTVSDEKIKKDAASIEKPLFVITREGALPGATNYVESWKENRDERVRFPMGLLWFDDTVGNFKRSPQPWFVDGVMVSRGKNWMIKNPKRDYKYDYPLLPTVYSDVYTGRVLDRVESDLMKDKFPVNKVKDIEFSQYRPPYQKNAWSPAKPEQGTRTNPLTGLTEKRLFPKNYGCDGGVDYGFLFTMRSGTPAFYDKTLESGTMYISGPRSGCTNSVIPANGLLNVPYFYEGCTCSYPLPASLSLVSMPESHEQWAVWGESVPKEMIRVGINFGAPGDRMTRKGTLWLNYPDVGGPSPKLDLKVDPESSQDGYRHSLWMKEGKGWPWVQASSLEGARSITLKELKPGQYSVRFYFAEEEGVSAGERIQNISLQGKQVINDYDIVKNAGGVMAGVVKEFSDVNVDGELVIQLETIKGKTRINGLELIWMDSLPN